MRIVQLLLGGLLIILGNGPLAFTQENRPAVPGGMYDKPYIEKFGRGTAVGGYIDMEWEITDSKNTFDQHRLIPFIFSEISDRIHFATEIEFEHGGRVPGDGEIKLEYAALDIRFTEWLSYRSGVLLSPLGKFNLVHDSPWNDFVSRPLVTRQIIPTTLSEAGMGFHGTFYPGEMAVLGYEIYLVNGFNENIITDAGFSPDSFTQPGFDTSTLDSVRVRSGRGSLASDNNTSKAFAGRLVYSPVLGVELGGSVHTGYFNQNNSKRLTITAFDLTLQRGPFEMLGEAAHAQAEISDGHSVNQVGYYLQPNYHFGFGLVPGFPESKFTAMIRAGYVDYNLNTDGGNENRYTIGLNWRPIEDTAVKAEYLIQQSTPANTTDSDDRTGTFFFGVTSYF